MTAMTIRSSQTPVLFDRYPGPESFQDNNVDRHLFFGREQEIQHLLHRIRAVRLLVIFGKSGLGKTSLLQAGLYPLLRKNGFFPVPVRLNQPGVEPVNAVLEALRAECRTHDVECPGSNTEGLWEFFKTTDLWQGDLLMMPVLVFDQFEELFTLHSESVCETVAAQLGELAVRGLPTRIRNQGGKIACYTDTFPDVKVILSLREEYVGALEDLAPNLPAVFEQRFRLAPLNKENAKGAVIKPAAQDNPRLFATRPFRYSKLALEGIMEFLANRKGEVEPFQLQIICQHAEQQVARQQREKVGEVEVDESLLGGHKAMEQLLENFYLEAIRKLPNGGQRVRARKLCEYGLLNPDGHRVSIPEGQIVKQFKLSGPSLEKLTKTRLIRKDTRTGLEGFYYELSHDSVARAVNRSRRFRVPTPVKLGLLLLMVIAGFLSRQWYMATQEARVAVQQIQVTTQASQSTVKDLLDRGGLIEPKMVAVSQGTFRMGSLKGEKDERPVREVTIPPFAIGRYEVTFDQYDQFALATGRRLPNDEGWGRGSRPVLNVSWDDAKAYAKWLSLVTGKRYRLSTEAEWEYAAKSGDKQEKWAGTSEEKQLEHYAVYYVNSEKKTAEVGIKKPNGLGVFDMTGNLWEWVKDCWHPNYRGSPKDGSAWLESDGGDCSRRVIRGGSWLILDPKLLRSSNRDRKYSDNRNDDVGFRLVQDTP